MAPINSAFPCSAFLHQGQVLVGTKVTSRNATSRSWTLAAPPCTISRHYGIHKYPAQSLTPFWTDAKARREPLKIFFNDEEKSVHATEKVREMYQSTLSPIKHTLRV